MIRILIQTSDATMAAHVGGQVTVEWRTFDVDAPEVEAFMQAKLNEYTTRSFVGVQLLAKVQP